MRGMPTVTLRGPLKQLAGNRGEHAVAGQTVVGVLKEPTCCTVSSRRSPFAGAASE
jgi:hypothetical protein